MTRHTDVPVRVLDLQSVQVSAQPLADNVFKIEGEDAYFLVNTSDGSVLIDTGTYYAQVDEQHKVMLEKATGPIRKIIATYFHSDHVGGLPRWKDHIGTGEIELIGHHRHVYMARIQQELTPYFNRRYHALYPNRVELGPTPPRMEWEMRPTRPVYPGSDYEFELGGVRFVVIDWSLA